MQGEVYSPSINLSAPVASSSMNYKQLTSVYGNNINEVTRLVGTIGSRVQKTDIVASSNDGSQGSKNQDGSTKDWGYDADGRFVNTKTGQTAAMGSMNDAVKAINTGNVSSKVLDRFAWEHKDNTTGYNSKEEYLAAQNTKVTYRDNDGNQSTVDSGSYNSSNDKSTGKIICDYFYRKGLLSKKLWEADEAYGVKLSISEPDVMRGYHAWAKHYVREMEEESLLGKVYFAWAKLWVPHWAKHLAGEKTIRGKILHSIGKPICTTPTGMEGVGGNAPKEAVVPPTIDNMNEGRAPMGEEMTDGGMTADQTGSLLSSQEDMAIASTFSTEQKELAKRILIEQGASPQVVAELDQLKTEEMIHIPVTALIQNPQAVMSQLEQVVAQMDTNAVDNNQMNSGMMSEDTMPDTTNRPPTQPV